MGVMEYGMKKLKLAIGFHRMQKLMISQIGLQTEQAVTYACANPQGADANGDGQSQLIRYWSYGFKTTQIYPAPVIGVASAVLADHVSVCNINYNAVNTRNGLVTITLEITRKNESIKLYHEVHVNNIP